MENTETAEPAPESTEKKEVTKMIDKTSIDYIKARCRNMTPYHPHYSYDPESALLSVAIHAVCKFDKGLLLHPEFVQWAAGLVFGGDTDYTTAYLKPFASGDTWLDAFYKVHHK